MSIGVLGGSFNPIHNGHLHIGKHVYDMLSLDRIIFIPTGDPPHKPSGSLASAHHRLQMVKLAIESYEAFTVDDREARSPNVSYTIDTVTQLKKEFPSGTELGFIIGLDAFLDFPTWKQAPRLLELCHFIVCSRPGASFTQLQSLPFFPSTPLANLENLNQQENARLDVALPSGTKIILLSVPPCEVSASQIRENIAKKQPVEGWLPPFVESYIIQHQLYQ